MALVNEGLHSFTVYLSPTHLSTSGMVPLLPSRRMSPHFGRYSFVIPLRVEGQVGLSGWSQTEEGKLSELFYFMLCMTVVHNDMHTHMNSS